MPGSGKSKVGQKLAEMLSLDFIDLDTVIEKEEQREIVEIFKNSGEAYFREIEQKLLKAESNKNENLVIATGGGAPCFFDNMEFMNRNGTTVFLDVPVTMIYQHLLEKGTESRPLLKDKQNEQLLLELNQKYSARLFYYNQARITLKQKYGDIEERTKEIVLRLNALKK